MNSNQNTPYAIGIDIGGTNTVFGLVNTRGVIVSTGAIKTRDYPDVGDYVHAVCDSLRPLVTAVGGIGQIKAIGIGAPNGNYYHGTIEHAPNLVWKGIVPLAELFEREIGLPVVVTNDANAAALGEMTYGVTRGMKHFIMITLGTGVGSGIVIDGRIVYGHDGFAGELGHVTVCPDGRLCGCGRRGCLETYCSATGVAHTAREMLESSETPSLLRRLDPDRISSKEVFDAAEAGDETAVEIFRRTGEILGKAFADFVAFSSPEAIVLFGGLTKAGDLIMRPIEESMNRHLLPIFRGKVRLLVSDLKDSDAAILGASALAWETERN